MDTFQSGLFVVVHCIIPNKGCQSGQIHHVQDCELRDVALEGVDFDKLWRNGSFAHSCSTPNHRLDSSDIVGVEYCISHIGFFVVQDNSGIISVEYHICHLGFFVV